MSDLLFVYGTLTDPAVYSAILGHAAATSPDAVAGFRVGKLCCGGRFYPILVEDPASAGNVGGLVLRVGPPDLRKLNRYEGRWYRRRLVTLTSGRTAWAYIR